MMFDEKFDGRMLFTQLAEKVLRGELLVTHFIADLSPQRDRGYEIQARMRTWDGRSLNIRAQAVAQDPAVPKPEPPMFVSIPHQVRELIFDDETPPPPIYDEDLK